MRFGATLPNNWGVSDPDALVALGPWCEERDFDSVWVNHHVLNIGYVRDRLEDRPYHDALTTLTWLAATTSRVRLGTSVLVLPYLHPMVLAKSLATLDVLSHGRVVAGVGVGSLQAEHDLLGVVPFADRGAYADECLEVMTALWTRPEPSFSGRWFHLDGALFSPAASQQPHPPLLIGGNRRVALRRVARFGQGWHPLGVSPEGMARRLAVLDEELAAQGRSRSDITISLRWDVSPSAEVRRWLEEFRALGVDEIVWSVGTPDLDVFRSTFEHLAEVARAER